MKGPKFKIQVDCFQLVDHSMKGESDPANMKNLRSEDHAESDCPILIEDSTIDESDVSKNKRMKERRLHRCNSLKEEQVKEIFMAGMPDQESATMTIQYRGQILKLAKKYEVTPKTIRDIWNRRTWKTFTAGLIHVTHGMPRPSISVSFLLHERFVL